MKRIITSILCIFMIFALSIPAFAATHPTIPPDGTVIVDEDGFFEATAEPNSLEPNFFDFSQRAAGPKYWYGCRASSTQVSGYSESYTQDKSQKYPIDYVYVRVRAYVKGAFVGANSNSATNSYRAACAQSTGLSIIGTGVSCEAKHEFRHSGYETLTPETSATQ